MSTIEVFAQGRVLSYTCFPGFVVVNNWRLFSDMRKSNSVEADSGRIGQVFWENLSSCSRTVVRWHFPATLAMRCSLLALLYSCHLVHFKPTKSAYEGSLPCFPYSLTHCTEFWGLENEASRWKGSVSQTSPARAWGSGFGFSAFMLIWNPKLQILGPY